VGCSGWQYADWRGNFYPAQLPQSRWLDYYAQRFDTVEVNNTFYRLLGPRYSSGLQNRVARGFQPSVAFMKEVSRALA
jgi:uncharacterized protein YecE (DUF72 family)